MVKFMGRLGEVWRCAGLYRMKEYEQFGIGPWQDSYLICVCEYPGITQEAIAKRIYVHKSNVARQIGALEEHGFVTRAPDPADRRNLCVFPTEKAFAAREHIRSVRAAWNARVLEGLSEEEQKTLAALLERLAENAKRVVEGRGEEER